MNICIYKGYIYRLYIGIFNICISTSFVCIFTFVWSLTVFSYTHIPVQTAGDPGVTEDPLGYFSAIVMFLQARPVPGESHVSRAGLASSHPQSVVSSCSVRGCHPAVILLDLHRKPPCWQTLSSMVRQKAWLGKYVKSNLAEQWLTQTSLCGGGWPVWQSWWQLCSAPCLRTSSSSLYMCRGPLQSMAVHESESPHLELCWASLSIFTLIPFWQISHLMMEHFLLQGRENMRSL